MPIDRSGSINWQDGMLIEAAHLTAETEYLRAHTAASARGGMGGFGLFAGPGEPSPLDLAVSAANGECRVELRRACACLPDGSWLGFEAGGGATPSATHAIPPRGELGLPVHLLVHAEEFELLGEPDPREDPPRQPLRRPLVQLALGDHPGWPRGRSLLLGRVMVRDGVATLDPGSLPPVLTMSSWPALRELGQRFGEQLERWRRIAVDNFIVLLPVATAPAGGVGREVEYAKRETAQQLALCIAMTQARHALLAKTGSPAGWFAAVQAVSRSLLTLMELNRDLAKAMQQATGDFEAGMGALRHAAAHEVGAESLGEMVAATEALIDGVERLLGGIFTAKAARTDLLRYRDVEYSLAGYAKRAYRREADREYLEISGIAEANVEDYVVVIGGDAGAAVRRSPPNTHIGPNERATWPQADPAFVDHSALPDAVLFHPHGLVLQKELNQLTLICLGGSDLSAFERGGDQDVRLFVRRKA